MFVRDGLHLSGNGAAVFTDELLGTVDTGMGSMKSIFGSKHYINYKRREGGYLEVPKMVKRPLMHTNQKKIWKLALNACV